MVIKNLVLCIFFFILTACSSRAENVYVFNATNLCELEQARYVPVIATSTRRSELSPMRLRLLEETAMTVSAQGGLSWASAELNCKMNRDRKYLDSIFNFGAMMLTHGVLPPVLEEGDFTLNLADPNTIRVADRVYKIVQQARFATTPPNWREYLLLSYGTPILPHRTLLPKNDAEQKIWKRAVRLGWQSGIDQAYNIFQQNLARLRRDYRGMILYRKLLQEKMISQPFVSRTELGVTGDGNDMRINDQVLRIIEHPQLRTNSKDWHAIVVKRHE